MSSTALNRSNKSYRSSSSTAKTYSQVKAIFAEARKRGLDNEALHDMVESITRRTRSISSLSYAEAQKVIQRLKGDEFKPLRTLQYHRQKAGIKQLVQDAQLTLIAELASQRNWSAESLTKFCRRQCRHDRPRTTEDANKVIEGLKAMNKREGLWAGA